MGINQTIFKAIEGILDPWKDYGCDKVEIAKFLNNNNFDLRKKEAVLIVNEIMRNHGKQELLRQFEELSRVEDGTRKLEPLKRDHVVHALLSFLLGIYINENYLKLLGYNVNPFSWKLAGLLHDVGYPMEVATSNIVNPYFMKINKIKRVFDGTAPDVFFKVKPIGLDKLTNKINSLDLIQNNLNEWKLEINARKEYEDMIESGQICHGIISSLTVLYIIDLMYQKYNHERKHEEINDNRGIPWNQSYFDNEVVSACSAIFVHNLPKRCFSSAKLFREQAPLAFLLRLTDCMQDWDRPLDGYPNGIPNDQFEIQIISGKLVFTVADKHRRDKIKSEVESILITTDIEIC